MVEIQTTVCSLLFAICAVNWLVELVGFSV